MSRPIKIWHSSDKQLPSFLKKISDKEDDIDWVAYVPREVIEDEFSAPSWLMVPAFNCCDVKWFKLPSGDHFVIGYHA